jgi:serine/threonine protein kinase
MDAPGTAAQTANCPACQQAVDLAGLESFSHVRCPYCDAVMTVPVEFGNFLLLNILGMGGMGAVYKAMDLTLHRPVALKVLKPKLAADPEFIASFNREARAAAAVSHINVCQIYSFGQQQGHYYIAMELLPQSSLDERIVKHTRLDEATVLELGLQIASGLRAAYRSGLLHRDVKPGNVLFSEDGMPKIVDFGLARAHDAHAGQATGQPIWGTPYYIAPEKLLGHGDDVRSDIYSLGATLFHALAGRPPFEAATATDVAVKHTTQPVTSLKTFVHDIQDQTAQTIGRMLAKNPAERYADYDQLIADLETARARLKALQAEKNVIVTETGERISLTSIIVTVAGLLVGLTIILLIIFNRHRFFPDSHQPAPGKTNATTNLNTPAGETEVSFNPSLPTGKLWQSAADDAVAGNTYKALETLATLRPLLNDFPRHREWVDLYEGLILLAADKQTDALSRLAGLTNRPSRLDNPQSVSTTNLAPVLAAALLEPARLTELETNARRLPLWAEGLVNLAAGFRYLQGRDLVKAGPALQAHARVVVGRQYQWMFALQPIASELGAECVAGSKAMEDAKKNPAKAASILQAAQARTKFPQVRMILKEREEALGKK